MMVLTPIISSVSIRLLLHYYDWESGGTGEGARYGGAYLGLLTFVNGALVLLIGIVC